MEVVVSAAEQWPGSVADAWCRRLAADPALRMVCPTGATPEPVYAEMARRVSAGEASFARAEVFVLDEYLGLPAGHPASCQSMLRRTLVDHVDLRPGSVHFFPTGAGDPAAGAAALDAEIGSHGFDLVIVGLGLNGHVGMNEPGSSIDSATRVVELAESTRRTAVGYGAGDPPTHGVTIGLDRIMESAEVWLIVTGGHKAEILDRALQREMTPAVPASLLRAHPALTVFADAPAASRLAPVG